MLGGLFQQEEEQRSESKCPGPMGTHVVSCCFLSLEYSPCFSSWPIEMPPALNQQSIAVETLSPAWCKCGVTEIVVGRWQRPR